MLVMAQSCARFGFEDLGLLAPDADAGSTAPDASNTELDAATPTGPADASQPDAGPSPPDAADASAIPQDAGPDAARPAPGSCAMSAPERLGSPNYPGNDLWSPSLASDGQSLFFAVLVPGWVEEIAVATRNAADDGFSDGQALPAPVNTDTEGTPNLAAGGLSLYFFSERPGGAGGRDLYVATRTSTSDEFADVRALAGLNTTEREHLPRVSADELTLYFVSNRSGDTEIWRATRASLAAEFADPELVPELNSTSEDGAVTVSPDGLEAILSSSRAGSRGRDLYRSTRRITSEPFSAPEPLPELNSEVNDYDPTLTFDGTELYFVSNRAGSNTEVYRSRRSCP